LVYIRLHKYGENYNSEIVRFEWIWSYKLSYFSRICGHLSGKPAATYIEDLRPLIGRICGHLSGGSAATYLVNCENKANSSQLELELGLSLAIICNFIDFMHSIYLHGIIHYTSWAEQSHTRDFL
jgi:hypothetical protein